MSHKLVPRRVSVRLLASVLALLVTVLLPVAHAADTSLEVRVKAAFMFNFAKFVSWPAAKLDGGTAPIVFCALDDTPMASALQSALAGKQIESHPLEVRRLHHALEFRHCDVAYLGELAAPELSSALAVIAGHHVLTTYDGDQTEHDGIVRFYLQGGSVRFEINLAAAQREDLNISSRLLTVATVVRE